MERLYRIISFPTFINMIENKVERYVNPTSWEDTYEGYMLRMMEKSENRKKVIEVLFDIVSPNKIEDVITNYLKLWAARWLCYGQCWSKTDESDAMWRIYCYDKMAVRIETTEDEIYSLLNHSNLPKTCVTEIRDVEYDLDSENILKSQAQVLKECQKTVDPFFLKRQAFEHENEKRVIIFDKEKSAITGLTAKGAAFNFHKNNQEIPLDKGLLFSKIEDEIIKMQYPYDEENLKREMLINIPDISRYIKSVMVHPQADDWIVNLVEKICNRVGIKCVGKSHMYDKLV